MFTIIIIIIIGGRGLIHFENPREACVGESLTYLLDCGNDPGPFFPGFPMSFLVVLATNFGERFHEPASFLVDLVEKSFLVELFPLLDNRRDVVKNGSEIVSIVFVEQTVRNPVDFFVCLSMDDIFRKKKKERKRNQGDDRI